jgi:hypothetical protein
MEANMTSLQQYHIVFQMKDEYKRTIGFELEYFGAGSHLPFDHGRKHNRETIRLRLDQAIKQKRLIFAKESDKYTALLLMMRDGNIKIPVVKISVGYRVGQDIYQPAGDQDPNQHYFLVDNYVLRDVEILRMSPRVRDRTPDSDLDLIDAVEIGFEAGGTAHYGDTEKMLQ